LFGVYLVSEEKVCGPGPHCKDDARDAAQRIANRNSSYASREQDDESDCRKPETSSWSEAKHSKDILVCQVTSTRQRRQIKTRNMLQSVAYASFEYFA
jgi:hypothetical protein